MRFHFSENPPSRLLLVEPTLLLVLLLPLLLPMDEDGDTLYCCCCPSEEWCLDRDPRRDRREPGLPLLLVFVLLLLLPSLCTSTLNLAVTSQVTRLGVEHRELGMLPV